jgi:hypothetical protein
MGPDAELIGVQKRRAISIGNRRPQQVKVTPKVETDLRVEMVDDAIIVTLS